MDATGLLYFKINNACIKLDSTLKKLLKRFGLTPSQFIFLSILEKYEKATSKMMAAGLSMDPSSLTPVIKKLLNSGHIIKIQSEDKRSYLLILTDKGRVSYHNSISVLSEFDDRLLNEFNADEKLAFDSALLKIERFIFKIQKQMVY